jgi:hypothetical protein
MLNLRCFVFQMGTPPFSGIYTDCFWGRIKQIRIEQSFNTFLVGLDFSFFWGLQSFEYEWATGFCRRQVCCLRCFGPLILDYKYYDEHFASIQVG